mgnify:FL=1
MNRIASSPDYHEATEEEVQLLARLNGLTISAGDLSEVTFRYRALLAAARRLDEIDLSRVEPIAVPPESDAR